MKEARYFYVPDAGAVNELPEEEAMHATRVLRLKNGDEMYLMDGAGTFYRAQVTLAANKRCLYEIMETMPQQPVWRGHIHIAVAPTKMMERVEWFVEKATEVGTDEFSFLGCQFSERKVLRIDRIEKIVVSAMKQSRKAWKPVVNEMESFKDFVSRPLAGKKYIAHCYEEIERKDLFLELQQPCAEGDDADVTVMIGPEGDFSIDEVRLAMEHGFVPVSLGPCRLRTETAALSAAMMAHLSRRLI
ncbi:MAG: 16S rRNA (uracil(1498)-N(3))-methyltransferase [Prevotella sp.]|nr:16S rRNA (uracil(1498)-N(3))-methyltransferase [Prevotella sp.]